MSSSSRYIKRLICNTKDFCAMPHLHASCRRSGTMRRTTIHSSRWLACRGSTQCATASGSESKREKNFVCRPRRSGSEVLGVAEKDVCFHGETRLRSRCLITPSGATVAGGRGQRLWAAAVRMITVFTTCVTTFTSGVATGMGRTTMRCRRNATRKVRMMGNGEPRGVVHGVIMSRCHVALLGPAFLRIFAMRTMAFGWRAVLLWSRCHHLEHFGSDHAGAGCGLESDKGPPDRRGPADGQETQIDQAMAAKFDESRQPIPTK